MKGGKKRKRKRRKSKHFLTGKFFILGGALFFIVLFYVWERTECMEASNGIRGRNRKKNELVKERELLLLETLRFKSPQRLESIAREEFGLVVPAGSKSIRRISLSHH